MLLLEETFLQPVTNTPSPSVALVLKCGAPVEHPATTKRNIPVRKAILKALDNIFFLTAMPF